MRTFTHLKVGDRVTRMLAGKLPMQMVVREVKEDTVRCAAVQEDGAEFEGDWEFDRETGCEEDHELGWGRKFGVTGSFIVMPETPN